MTSLHPAYEPDWRSGQHVPTRIARSDGQPLGITGLWQPWKSPEGNWIQSFTMLTINADSHPIFNQLHRPDPKRTPDKQDKRMVVILPEEAYGAWLDAPRPRGPWIFYGRIPPTSCSPCPNPKPYRCPICFRNRRRIRPKGR